MRRTVQGRVGSLGARVQAVNGEHGVRSLTDEAGGADEAERDIAADAGMGGVELKAGGDEGGGDGGVEGEGPAGAVTSSPSCDPWMRC